MNIFEDVKCVTDYLGPVLIVMFSSGFIWNMYNSRQIRKSNIKKLTKLSNRLGGDIVVLSTTMGQILTVLDAIVDTLHDKGVLNGNSVEIKQGLKETKKFVDQYAQEQKNKGLFFEEEN